MRLLMLLSMAAGFAFGTPPAAAAHAELFLSWRLLGNKPDGGYEAELCIRNDGTEALPRNWTIFFNSASRLLPESLSAEYKLNHINGDFYSLQPTDRYTPIEPGKIERITYDGSPWAVNVSDAPSGFYLVGGDSGRSGSLVSLPLHIEPFPDADRLRRGAKDVVPVVTADLRFEENESLELLPADSLIKVVPTPCSVQPGSGSVKITKVWTVLCDHELESEANQLIDSLAPLLGATIASSPTARDIRPSPQTIVLRLDNVQVGSEVQRAGDEAYQLSVSADSGIEIVGSDAAGVFYGIQTLRALLPIKAYREAMDELEIEAVQIADAPRFRYRGVHLDVARNFHSKETVKKLLDLIAFYKLNRLHWHLTDDEGWRIEIRQLPELTAVGGRRGHTVDEQECLMPSHGSGPDPTAATSAGHGYYSQSDIVDILRHANDRHITVIPEIDLPGHARAAIKALAARARINAAGNAGAAGPTLQLRAADDSSEYESVQFWHDNVVDVGRDDTYRFLSIVVDELASIYDQAGVPLTSIHLGGDEVPNGAWDHSAACASLELDKSSTMPRHAQLQLYFLDRASEMLARKKIQPACWEDCLLLETERNRNAGNDRRTAKRPTPTAYVWNSVWGWGREDAAYRLANAGFDVVLCNATHLYFDLACEKDPLEPGYYWAGFVDTRKPFEFVPLDVFKNADLNSMGQPVSAESLANRTQLTEDGERHILGIQGQLWGENLRDAESLEYMAFPRLIALAERAWAASPAWASVQNAAARAAQLDADWNQFANRLGQRELPRLDWLFGGVNYRLPPPGAAIRDGFLQANVAYPGMDIRYTTDGTEPHAKSSLYRKPVRHMGSIQLKSFNSRGRGSRSLTITPPGRD